MFTGALRSNVYLNSGILHLNLDSRRNAIIFSDGVYYQTGLVAVADIVYFGDFPCQRVEKLRVCLEGHSCHYGICLNG